jgi:uncharacterized membrane protein YqjE
MIDQLAATAAIAVRQAGAYSELIRDDLDVQARLLRDRLAVGAVTAVALQLVAMLGCGLVMALSWDTPYRLWILGGLILAFASVAALGIWRMRLLDKAAPPVLQLTAGEWAKDRRLLEDLLSRHQAGSA